MIKFKMFFVIIISLMFLSCEKKELKNEIIVNDLNQRYEVSIRDIKGYSKDSVEVDFQFNKDNTENAIISIRNKTKRNVILNNWINSNSSLVIEIRDNKGQIVPNLPYSVPPENITKYDTLLKPNQCIEYEVTTFSSSSYEKDEGEIFVKIGYVFENEKDKMIAESNRFYYKKTKIKVDK